MQLNIKALAVAIIAIVVSVVLIGVSSAPEDDAEYVCPLSRTFIEVDSFSGSEQTWTVSRGSGILTCDCALSVTSSSSGNAHYCPPISWNYQQLGGGIGLLAFSLSFVYVMLVLAWSNDSTLVDPKGLVGSSAGILVCSIVIGSMIAWMQEAWTESITDLLDNNFVSSDNYWRSRNEMATDLLIFGLISIFFQAGAAAMSIIFMLEPISAAKWMLAKVASVFGLCANTVFVWLVCWHLSLGDRIDDGDEYEMEDGYLFITAFAFVSFLLSPVLLRSHGTCPPSLPSVGSGDTAEGTENAKYSGVFHLLLSLAMYVSFYFGYNETIMAVRDNHETRASSSFATEQNVYSRYAMIHANDSALLTAAVGISLVLYSKFPNATTKASGLFFGIISILIHILFLGLNIRNLDIGKVNAVGELYGDDLHPIFTVYQAFGCCILGLVCHSTLQLYRSPSGSKDVELPATISNNSAQLLLAVILIFTLLEVALVFAVKFVDVEQEIVQDKNDWDWYYLQSSSEGWGERFPSYMFTGVIAALVNVFLSGSSGSDHSAWKAVLIPSVWCMWSESFLLLFIAVQDLVFGESEDKILQNLDTNELTVAADVFRIILFLLWTIAFYVIVNVAPSAGNSVPVNTTSEPTANEAKEQEKEEEGAIELETVDAIPDAEA